MSDPKKRVIEIGWRPVEGWPSFAAVDGSPYNVWPELDPEHGFGLGDRESDYPEDWLAAGLNRLPDWEPTDDWSQRELDLSPVTAILHFDLMDRVGRQAHVDSLNGPTWRGAMQALDTWLRSKLEHAELDESSTIALEACLERLCLVIDPLPLWD